MKEIRTNPPACVPFRERCRLTSITSLCGVVLLGLGGWAHFSSQPSDDIPEAAVRDANHVNPVERLAVSRIQNDFDRDDGPAGAVKTVSATRSSAVPGYADADADADSDPESDPQGTDDRLRQAILGKWEDEYRGKRQLTVHDDGTGTMIVEPDGIGKRLFAAELRFELEWTLADGHVTMKMIRGEPKSKVQLILKLHGQEADYKILDLTNEQMLLLDPDGKTRYDWRRPGTTADKTK